MIPTVSKVLSGNMAMAAHYLGLAQRQLDILLNDMASARPKALKTGERKLNLDDGAYIIVNACYNARRMKIHVPESSGGKKEGRWRECLCNCNFTTGQIVEKQEEAIEEASLYTVMACTNKERYVIHKNVLASDFTDYIKGQIVLLIPYNDMEFQCCIEQTPAVMGCSPLESSQEVSNEAWRSTLRIIPWCGASIPQWMEVEEGRRGGLRKY